MAIRKRRRSKAEIERDRRRIADLYLKGWLQADIGEELGLAQSTISRDIRALHEQWQESALIDFDRAKAEELAKVDRLEREYWIAWERSCENAETATHKAKGKIQKRVGEDGKFVAEQPAEVSKTSKGQAGDPRFLAGVQWCIERRCKILGLDAPGKLDLTSGGESLEIALNRLASRVIEMDENEFVNFAGTLPDFETGSNAASETKEPR